MPTEMKEPDFSKVFETIAEIFSECDLSSFPIELGKISERYSNLFKIRTFSDLEKSHYRKWLKRVSGDTISDGIGTEDGFTIKDTVDDINNLVFINEKKPVARQRFTLAHELGHIFMDHLYGTNCTLLLNSDYSEDGEHAALENEANAFARNLLAPAKAVLDVFDKNGIRPVLRNGFKIYKSQDNPLLSPADLVSRIFDISKQAAQIRINCLDFDLYMREIN